MNVSQTLLFVSKYPPFPGGVSAENYWLVRGLRARGWDIAIVSESPKIGNDSAMDVGSWRDPRLFLTSPSAGAGIPFEVSYAGLTSLLLEVASKTHPVAIYAHFLFPYGFAGSIVAHWLDLPFILRLEGSDFAVATRKNFSHFLRKTIESSRFVLCSTREAKRRLEDVRIPTNSLLFVPSYLPNDEFSPKVKPLDLERLIRNFRSNIPTILCPGKLEPWKSIPEILRASEGLLDELNILFIGSGSLKHVVEKYAERNAGIYLMPPQPPWLMPSAIKASFAVMNARRPMIPQAQKPVLPFEAMSVGKPIIASMFIPGIKEVIEDGKNGFLFDPRTVPRIRSVLSRVVRLTSREYAWVCRNATRTAGSFESGISTIDVLEEIFLTVAQDKDLPHR